MNKQVKVLLLCALATVAISTVGVSGCVSSAYDPDVTGAWRRDYGDGCYQYDIFTDSGMDVGAFGVSACGDNNGSTFVSTYTVDTSVTPHQMDVYTDEGGHILAIYEVSGDTLKAAASEAPNPRPTEFTESEYVEIVEFVRLP